MSSLAEWELVDDDVQTACGSQQVNIDEEGCARIFRWERLVSVGIHYYRLRRVMGAIGEFLKRNKSLAIDELLEQFPEINPKRAAKLAKQKARSLQKIQKKSKSRKQRSIAESIGESDVIVKGQ